MCWLASPVSLDASRACGVCSGAGGTGHLAAHARRMAVDSLGGTASAGADGGQEARVCSFEARLDRDRTEIGAEIAQGNEIGIATEIGSEIGTEIGTEIGIAKQQGFCPTVQTYDMLLAQVSQYGPRPEREAQHRTSACGSGCKQGGAEGCGCSHKSA